MQDDETLAQRLQQEEIERTQNVPIVVGQPYISPYYDASVYEPILPSTQTPTIEREEYLLDTVALACCVICLSFCDIVLILVLSFYNIYYICFIFFPFFGLIGGFTYESCWVYFYLAFYLFRLTGDVIQIIYQNYWAILFLFLDLLFFSLILIFAIRISLLNREERELVQSPGPMYRRRRRFYYVLY